MGHSWHLLARFRTTVAILRCCVCSDSRSCLLGDFACEYHCVWLTFWSQLGRVIVCGDVEVRCRLSCRAERTAGRGGIRPAAEERPDTPLRDSVCKRAHMQMCNAAREFVLILYMVRHTFILICMCSLVCSMWAPVMSAWLWERRCWLENTSSAATGTH